MGIGVEPRPPKCSPLFTALGMASPDIVNVVCRAAIDRVARCPVLNWTVRFGGDLSG